MRTPLVAAIGILLLALGGCTRSFDREWRTSAGETARAGDILAGRWQGEWRSKKHRNAGGQLQAVLTPVAPDRYRASFKAHWMIFTSSYSTVFETQRIGREVRFQGSQNLGSAFGGVYTFKGNATAGHFIAHYDSSYDRGIFEMQRSAAQ